MNTVKKQNELKASFKDGEIITESMLSDLITSTQSVASYTACGELESLASTEKITLQKPLSGALLFKEFEKLNDADGLEWDVNGVYTKYGTDDNYHDLYRCETGNGTVYLFYAFDGTQWVWMISKYTTFDSITNPLFYKSMNDPLYMSDTMGQWYGATGGMSNGHANVLPNNFAMSTYTELLQNGNQRIQIADGYTYFMQFDIGMVNSDFSVNRWILSATAQNTGGVVAGVDDIYYANNMVATATGWTYQIYPNGPAKEDSSNIYLVLDTDSESNAIIIKIYNSSSSLIGSNTNVFGTVDIIKLKMQLAEGESYSGGTLSYFASAFDDANANGTYTDTGLTWNGYPVYQNMFTYQIYNDGMGAWKIEYMPYPTFSTYRYFTMMGSSITGMWYANSPWTNAGIVS